MIQATKLGLLWGEGVPLYRRIADCVSEYIRMKKFTQGTRLPTISQLADHFRVSIVTVRTA